VFVSSVNLRATVYKRRSQGLRLDVLNWSVRARIFYIYLGKGMFSLDSRQILGLQYTEHLMTLRHHPFLVNIG